MYTVLVRYPIPRRSLSRARSPIRPVLPEGDAIGALARSVFTFSSTADDSLSLSISLALKGKTQDVSALLSKFKMAQERHVQARREAFRKKSLQSEASTTTAEK